MCLILFAYDMHPIYKLIVAANRDEFYQRPTAPAQFWEDNPNILAGRDLEKMGTWMGVTKTGRFSALTNYRDPNELNEGKHSRGEIVANFLKDSGEPINFMKTLEEMKTHYPGYNFLAGNIHELYYYSNRGNEILKLEKGIYGLSNHLLDSDWPKVKKGKVGLEKILLQQKEDMSEELFQLLHNTDKADDHFLPNTGVPYELEKLLSSMFIESPDYGTRCSTVLLMSENTIHFWERSFIKNRLSNQHFHFKTI